MCVWLGLYEFIPPVGSSVCLLRRGYRAQIHCSLVHRMEGNAKIWPSQCFCSPCTLAAELMLSPFPEETVAGGRWSCPDESQESPVGARERVALVKFMQLWPWSQRRQRARRICLCGNMRLTELVNSCCWVCETLPAERWIAHALLRRQVLE